MNTIDKIEKTLSESVEIAEWYRVEHSVTIGDLNETNIREYGISGYGEIAGAIIQDGIDSGIINNDEE